jgi:hypothetical protein
VSRVSALWRLEAFLDRDEALTSHQRLALITWILELQERVLPPPAVQVTDARGQEICVAILDAASVAVTYRIMATGRPRLLRIERLG